MVAAFSIANRASTESLGETEKTEKQPHAK
jgi:hypothetical protein